MIAPLIHKLASNFLSDKDGAVTVDWVMLTAGIVLLGGLVLIGIKASLLQTSADIAVVIDSASSALN